MATEQIISPGVFTRENDLSFLPAGVGAIGAAIVGPTVKGPAFVPTVIRSFKEFENRFGPLSSETYVPQTVREYLKSAGAVTVVRVLAGGGYTFTSGGTEPIAVIAGSGSATSAVAATSSLIIAGTFGQTAFDELQITPSVGGTEYRLVAYDTATAPADNSPLFYFATGSTTATAIDNIVAKIGTANALGAGVAAYDGTTHLNFTASSAGTAGNVISIETGSGATIGTDVSASILFGGGIDATVEGGVLVGLIYPSKATATPSLSTTVTSPTSGHVISSSFAISLNGSGVSINTFSASINPSNSDYLFKYVGYNPLNSKDTATSYDGMPGFTHLNFKSIQTNILATDNLAAYSGLSSGSILQLAKMSSVDATFNELSKTEGYSYSSTPMIQSQIALGQKSLFQFHTLDHGDLSTKYKISIANLKEPGDIDGVEQYSTFSVLVRDGLSDNDKKPTIIETYNNCSLNPDSPNYISRRVGDRYPEYNETLEKVELLGNYPNISKCIRVQVSNAVGEKSTSPKLSPKGFAVVSNTFNTASLTVDCIFPSASYEGVQQLGTDNTYNAKGYLGWKFNEKETDNANFQKPLPQSAESNIAGAFSVENYSGHASSSLWSGSLSASIGNGNTGPISNQLKFTVPFQGGDDGDAPWTVKKVGEQIAGNNLYGYDLSTTSATGYIAYKKALDILSNQDEYDINMLAMPGVIHALHPLVTNKGIDICEERGDCFFVMDLNEAGASVNQAVANVAGIDTNYAAVYYPWVKVLDTAANRPVLVPPSVIVPGAIAASDKTAAEWFAPAGLNRGVLGNVIEAKIRLNQAERDTLYNEKINPIATFPQTGVCIWGQKTLQERSTALDRINVRRLLIALKKFIASSSRYLVFEQNTLQTRTRFLNIVNPYLESVQQRQGLYAFRVQMDESNNTPTVIDRNQLVGAIYLQPAKTAEFIVLDFNVLPTGATFDA